MPDSLSTEYINSIEYDSVKQKLAQLWDVLNDLTNKSSASRKLRYAEVDIEAEREQGRLLPDELLSCSLQDLSDRQIQLVAHQLQQWQIKPNATEGYRTAEVTLGGVDCDALSSKTMASKQVPGLYFIGEVVDVSGWLGGYNFQWAWSSAWCAGQYV